MPLHHGKAPKWLFERMTALSREIMYALVSDLGQKELLKKISDPYWFQALGCILGFDWHSSGLTTTVTGALKEGLRGMERELGVYIAGGKGATARKTPGQIESSCERFSAGSAEPLIYASRMSAKVDNTAIQDGYDLYHHVFVFTRNGEWAIVQQGMNSTNRTARRYHWLSSSFRNFVVEPHTAVCCDRRESALNMVARESEESRNICTELSRENPDKVVREIKKAAQLDMTKRHTISIADIHPAKLHRILLKTYELQPDNFERLLGIRGIGPRTVRALSLISELLYGKSPSYRDPARFSFAHGGKDGIPFPVDKTTYDRSIAILRRAVNAAKIGRRDKIEAIRRMAVMFGD